MRHLLSSRRSRWSAFSVVLLLAGAGLAGVPVYVSPRIQSVSPRYPADAVVALGGLVETAAQARDLTARGLAPELVLSDPYRPRVPWMVRLCADPPAAYRVTCFSPDPSTTRGEAREIARLAAERGWHRVIVMTPVYHISRARMIIRRCYGGTLDMVPTPVDTNLLMWIYQYGYQTAGYLKAALQDGC